MDNLPRGVMPATPELASAMAPRLSPEHRREILATAGMHPGDALALSLAASLEAYAFVPRAEEGAVFMMGVEEASRITGTAMVWMLGTLEMQRYPARVLRAARWGVKRAFAVTGAAGLEQYIPRWYGTGLRFVQRLGFALTPLRVRGYDGGDLWRVVVHAAALE